jgi:hypothetical protein
MPVALAGVAGHISCFCALRVRAVPMRLPAPQHDPQAIALAGHLWRFHLLARSRERLLGTAAMPLFNKASLQFYYRFSQRFAEKLVMSIARRRAHGVLPSVSANAVFHSDAASTDWEYATLGGGCKRSKYAGQGGPRVLYRARCQGEPLPRGSMVGAKGNAESSDAKGRSNLFKIA